MFPTHSSLVIPIPLQSCHYIKVLDVSDTPKGWYWPRDITVYRKPLRSGNKNLRRFDVFLFVQSFPRITQVVLAFRPWNRTREMEPAHAKMPATLVRKPSLHAHSTRFAILEVAISQQPKRNIVDGLHNCSLLDPNLVQGKSDIQNQQGWLF